MPRRLPPLSALRVFEAAGRHLSFTKAAEELSVTQAAVSHQIKSLEEWLGVPLFRRMNRALQLTEVGQAYLPCVTMSLDGLSEATERLFRQDAGGALTVSTMPSWAAKWLVMRLGRFQDRHPDIDVRLQTSSALVDFARNDVDLAIRFGKGDWPGLRCDWLMDEEVFPVCSPALLKGPKPLETPADLRRHALLHDDYLITWDMWFAAAGLSGVNTTRGTRFTDSALMLQAAMAGQGVSLARIVLVADDLAAGRLVRLFDVTLRGELAYYVVAPPHYFQRTKVKAFRDWLFEEVALDRRERPGREESAASARSLPDDSVATSDSAPEKQS